MESISVICLSEFIDQLLQALYALNGNYHQQLLLVRLHNVQFILWTALDQLQQITAYGDLDKLVFNNIKYSLYQLEFLINQIKVYDPQGTNNNEYLRKLAKNVVMGLPTSLDPVEDGRSLVREIVRIVKEEEKEDITRLLLLEDSESDHVTIVPVLGMKSIGQANVVRVVYHDQRVQNHFDIKLWVDVSGYSADAVLAEFVSSLKRDFEGKKYLLVLQDYSAKNGADLVELLQPLLSESANYKPGSKILVSSKTISLEPHIRLPMTKGAPYLLAQPDNKECLALFKNLAFRGIAEDRDTHLMEIGLQIFFKYCANNLNVITIIASMLSFEYSIEKWQHFNDTLLGSVENPGEYIHLASDLIQGLNAYTRPLLFISSLFPSDYEFSKEELFQLWEVQGFLGSVSSHRIFSEYFEKLLIAGYFFEKSRSDETGFIVKYGVHILMQEVVKHSARDDYCLVDSLTKKVHHQTVQHVSFIVDSDSWEAPPWLCKAKQLKSLIFLTRKLSGFITIPKINQILENLKGLQTLDLRILDCRSCLDTIGELKHLRYIRFGNTSELVVECITKLQFLQTLDIKYSKLQRLQGGLHELSLLRHLYIGNGLVELPSMLGELREHVSIDVSIIRRYHGLDAVVYFTHPRGDLKIDYPKGHEKNVYMGSHELFQASPTLKCLAITVLKVESFPLWVLPQFSVWLNSIVSIHIADCNECKDLPSFSKLVCLESLHLQGLTSLEWIEVIHTDDSKSSASAALFFPVLKSLCLVNLPQLKGWSEVKEQPISDINSDERYNRNRGSYVKFMRERDRINLQLLKQKVKLHRLKIAQSRQFFGRLSELRVSGCPALMSLPRMPGLNSLELSNIHENLLQSFLKVEESAQVPTPSLRSLKLTNISIPKPFSNGFERFTTLEQLTLGWLYNLRTLPESLSKLTQLRGLVLRYLPNLIELPESLGDLSILQHFEIQYCPKLNQLPRSFPDLKDLKRLVIKECMKLKKRCNDEDCHLITHIPYCQLE